MMRLLVLYQYHNHGERNYYTKREAKATLTLHLVTSKSRIWIYVLTCQHVGGPLDDICYLRRVQMQTEQEVTKKTGCTLTFRKQDRGYRAEVKSAEEWPTKLQAWLHSVLLLLAFSFLFVCCSRVALHSHMYRAGSRPVSERMIMKR